jgi:uncharacterized membrane protein YqjE
MAMEGVHHNGFETEDIPAVEGSVTGAFERVVDASQRVLGDHIELIRLEVRDGVAHVVAGGALVGTGVLFAFAAWCGLMAAFVALLTPTLSLPVALFVVVFLTAIASAVCVAGGVRRVGIKQKVDRHG